MDGSVDAGDAPRGVASVASVAADANHVGVRGGNGVDAITIARLATTPPMECAYTNVGTPGGYSVYTKRIA